MEVDVLMVKFVFVFVNKHILIDIFKEETNSSFGGLLPS